MSEKGGDAQTLGLVVLHEQQMLAARLCIGLQSRQCLAEAFRGRRLAHEGEGAAGQPMLTILVEADDLDRNMPRLRILLELAQHRPAEHVGQEDVERDRRRPVVLRECERIAAAHRHQNLESIVAGEIHQDAGVMRIVLDDEQHRVAGRYLMAIVFDMFGRLFGAAVCCRLGEFHDICRRNGLRRNCAGADIGEWQIENEGAADTGGAAQLDLAAEQVCQFAADRQAEACAAIFAACRGIRLLERLEMMRCFSGGMPMPVSTTSKAMTEGACLSEGWSDDQPLVADATRSVTPPCAVNLKAFDSRFFRICWRRFESVMMLLVISARPRPRTTGCDFRLRAGTAGP